ncbi:MAG: TRAP transporter large permease subunit [Clostridia bacterium]|nr:TRAP transporter large permease subunit [Clostridia bacterium]
MNPTLVIAIVMFALTYVLLLTLSKYRAFVALGSAIIFSLWLLFLTPDIEFTFWDVLGGIDFNVLMMIAGTMGIVSLFIKSGMPMKIADLLLSRFSSVKTAIVAMAVLSGIISAFVDNVATVLMIAPIALAVCKKQGMSPVAPIICISVSSNLQGAATLVGDTTSVLLAKEAGMNFFDFFWFQGRPGIFWAVELGAFATVFILLFLFRKENQKMEITSETKVNDLIPSFLMGGVIVLLIIASFLPEPENEVLRTIYAHRNGIICMLLLIIGLIISLVRTKKTEDVELVFSEMDYQTLLLLASLFVVITSIDAAGVIDMLANLLTQVGGGNVFLLYTIIVFASVIISAFVDNIPYVMTMLPVVSGVAGSMGFDPTVLYFGLLIGATLGGNITPIGASANITGIGILRREGHEVGVGEFMKISVPFTLTAVLTGYLYIWIVYGLL